jgi:hypothetical protein
MGCNNSKVEDVEDPKAKSTKKAPEPEKPKELNPYSANASKQLATRVDNAEKFIDGLIKFLNQRAEIEGDYARRLKSWEGQWNTNMAKHPGTNEELASVFRALTTEADAQASVHKKRQASLQTNSAKVTEWKALNYHSKGLLSSGTKEGEELEKMLQEATGPWNASLQNVMRLKNEFHELSKKAILADAEVTAGTAKYGADSKQMANLKHTKANTETARDAKEDEYVAALGQLPVLHPEVCEKVKIAIEKLRALEIKRLEFVKSIWTEYMNSIAFTTSDANTLNETYDTITHMISKAEINKEIDELTAKANKINPKIPEKEEFSP